MDHRWMRNVVNTVDIMRDFDGLSPNHMIGIFNDLEEFTDCLQDAIEFYIIEEERWITVSPYALFVIIENLKHMNREWFIRGLDSGDEFKIYLYEEDDSLQVTQEMAYVLYCGPPEDYDYATTYPMLQGYVYKSPAQQEEETKDQIMNHQLRMYSIGRVSAAAA